MEEQQWKKISKILDTALELKKEKRSAYIEKECTGDQQLKQTVTELLKSIEESNNTGYLEGAEAYPNELAIHLSKDEQRKESSLIGKKIGNYKILELIGHGGMGSVFLTERTDEAYDKKVALKLLRRGMDTPSNIARFRRERNILANLDHPNIARLLDGGVTDDGLPYLVMEYVEGTPLYEYCDNRQLSIEDRLELFQSICRAVQHAHKNAVIHRDLKPSNILVTDDEKIKILDFGIAKMMDPDDPKNNLYQTRTGARMLTLGYAAPEQIESEAITTATDVYTLGLLLYELLAGTHPFDLDRKNLTEIETIIRDEIPKKPSDKISALSASKSGELAKLRNTKPYALAKTLAGDLDAIVTKALRKEQNSRYDSAGHLLEDLERRKENLPVIARDDTLRYNTKKLLKRHLTSIGIAAGFLFLLLSFTAFYTWQIAEERNKAKTEAEKAQLVSNFLTDLFRASDPMFNPQDTVTAATFLQRGKKRIDQLDDQPEVKAKLLRVMGRAHVNLGEFNEAKPLLYKSLALRQDIFKDDNPKIANSLSSIAYLHQRMGNFAKSESLEKQALIIQQKTLSEDHKDIATTFSELAYVISRQGRYKKADSLYQKAFSLQQKKMKSNHPDIGETLNDWGFTLRQLGEYEKAVQMKEKALSIWRQNYGEVHPAILEVLNDLAVVKEEVGDFAAADSLYQKALEVDRQLSDGPNPGTAQLLNNIGATSLKAGHLDKAESYLKKSLVMRQEVLRPTHPSMAESYINLGRLYIDTEKFEKAKPMIQNALQIDKKQHGTNHPYVAGDLRNLGFIAKQRGNYDKAEEYFRKSLNILNNTLPSDHPSVAVSLASLGKVFNLKEDYPAAKPLLEESLEILEKKFDKDDIRIAQSQIPLGVCLMHLQKYERSEELLKSGYQTYTKERGLSNKNTQKARKYLVDLYEAWGKTEMAEKYQKHS